MEKKNIEQNVNWPQIIITAIITGLVSLIVAIVVFYYTTEKTELIYEEFPISTFQSDQTELSILNYSVKNVGQKTAKNVRLYVKLPNSAIIKEPNIKVNNALTKYAVIDRKDNLIVYNISSLFQYDNFNISILAENLVSNDEVSVEVRSDESVGKLFEESENEVSPVFIYVAVILIIIFIILVVVLIFTAKRAIKAFGFLRKRINKETDIENRKVKDIITQGVDYCDMGMQKESIKVLRKGKYLHPESSSIHSNLGRAYAKNSEFEKAEVEFKIAEKLIKDDTDKLIYNYTKAHYFALLDKKQLMIEHIEKAQKFGKDRVQEKMMLDDEFNKYKDDSEFLELTE